MDNKKQAFFFVRTAKADHTALMPRMTSVFYVAALLYLNKWPAHGISILIFECKQRMPRPT